MSSHVPTADPDANVFNCNSLWSNLIAGEASCVLVMANRLPGARHPFWQVRGFSTILAHDLLVPWSNFHISKCILLSLQQVRLNFQPASDRLVIYSCFIK